MSALRVLCWSVFDHICLAEAFGTVHVMESSRLVPPPPPMSDGATTGPTERERDHSHYACLMHSYAAASLYSR